MPNLTKRLIDDMKPGAKAISVWDAELPGFGLRVHPSGVKSYILRFRNAAQRERLMVLGRHGVLTVVEARKKARKLLVAIIDGADPVSDKNAVRAAPTVNELIDRHIEEHVKVHNTAQTLAGTLDLLNRLARPALSTLKADSVTARTSSNCTWRSRRRHHRPIRSWRISRSFSAMRSSGRSGRKIQIHAVG